MRWTGTKEAKIRALLALIWLGFCDSQVWNWEAASMNLAVKEIWQQSRMSLLLKPLEIHPDLLTLPVVSKVTEDAGWLGKPKSYIFCDSEATGSEGEWLLPDRPLKWISGSNAPPPPTLLETQTPVDGTVPLIPGEGALNSRSWQGQTAWGWELETITQGSRKSRRHAFSHCVSNGANKAQGSQMTHPKLGLTQSLSFCCWLRALSHYHMPCGV